MAVKPIQCETPSKQRMGTLVGPIEDRSKTLDIKELKTALAHGEGVANLAHPGLWLGFVFSRSVASDYMWLGADFFRSQET